MSKLTENDIRKVVEDRGYDFIEMERIADDKNRRHIYITIKCENNHITKMRWDAFRRGCKCKYCSNNVKFTIEDVRKYIESFGYKMISNEYKNKDEKIEIECNLGHRYKTPYNVFRRGFRCPICSKKKKYTFKDVKNIIELEGYKLLSKEYQNANEKILIQCPNNHKPYLVTFSDFNNNKRRCPHCKESKGEKKIGDLLKKYNIKYETQYKFENCKCKKRLPFDFYLNDLNCCIEYDGEGHYKQVNWKGNKEIAFDCFVGTIIRDTIKNEYCKNNNIKLIRIPYWDFDKIENILKYELKL